ncbi:uncharacterized protein [Asterias amurensis]|uniref:uncharacterized protein n=1 Tax=Asterias amurensis TaxID=7602 RepID=UPI003AB7EADE
MGILHLIVSCFVIFLLCLPSPGHCEVTVSRVSVYPQQPFTNGTVTLTCLATGFDPDVHMFTWQHYVSPSYSEVMEDDRISVSPVDLDKETSTLHSQNLTITTLTSTDAGSYLCVIIRKDNKTVITNREGRLTVNSTEEFPVCFPDGPAVVNEGDILTCSTVIDERTPLVSDTNSTVERPDWEEINSTQAGNEPGSRLQKSVKVSDEGVTFFCFSITPENQNWTSLSCKIGPLTVIPAPTTPKQPLIQPTGEPALPTAVLIVIVVGAFLLLMLLLLLFLLIHTICCRYKPKKYLLNFGGFFSGTIRRRQSSKRLKQTDVELDRQTPDGSDEPNPAEDDRFSSEDGADRDVLPIVEIEPNIYEDQGNPGTSFQREDEPEVGGYWDADLKQQLAEAVGEGDFYSD